MTPDHKQIKHDLNIEARLHDYMDELDLMTEDVDPGQVRLRLRNILGRAEDAAFQRALYGHPED